MPFCVGFRKLMVVWCIGTAFFFGTSSYASTLRSIIRIIPSDAMVVRIFSFQSYSKEHARAIFYRAQEEMVRKQVQPVIDALWNRALVQLGRRYACPHGTEDHCDDIHFYQEGLRYMDHYKDEYPDLAIVVEREIQHYYRLAALVCAGKEYFSYGCAEEFLLLTVGRLVDSIELHIELMEQGMGSDREEDSR